MLTIHYQTGFAGTGKSHDLLQLVNSLPHETTVVIAPTHKALHRLTSKSLIKAEVKTVHSLLGWIPTINESAEHVDHIDATRKLDKDILEYDNIVIDEAGMLSEEMLMEITGNFVDVEDTKDINIYCFLDPYQLLPVKGHQIQTDPLTTTNVTKQYRAESPDVVALFMKFVEYQIGTNDSDLTTPHSANVRPFDLSEFKEGDRLLAYTNAAVGQHNKAIARHLGINGYEGTDVMLGNSTSTIFCDGFVEPNLDDLINAYQTSHLVLQNAQISKKYVEASLKALITNSHIKFMDAEGYLYPVLVGNDYANKAIKQAKEAAISDKRKFKDVYALGRAFTMDYPFATTVHKAQGSEWDRVFIDKADIQKSIRNGYYQNYARLMYVAISRSRKTVFI